MRSPLTPPPYCLGCPHPIYDDRRGKGWQWYYRQHSPTGIKSVSEADDAPRIGAKHSGGDNQ